MFHVTRRYHMAASHRLHAPSLSEEENYRIYGKCNNPYGHGHNYVVEVGARGPIDERSGSAVDVAALDSLVRGEILSAFDHRNLNTEIPVFRTVVPTSENLAVEICRRLKVKWSAAFPGEWPKLYFVRIAETERNIFEIKADEIQ